jgi:hypothetical protein
MTEPMYQAVEQLSKDHALDLSEVVRRLVSRQLRAKSSAEIDTPYQQAQNRLTRSIY